METRAAVASPHRAVVSICENCRSIEKNVQATRGKWSTQMARRVVTEPGDKPT